MRLDSIITRILDIFQSYASGNRDELHYSVIRFSIYLLIYLVEINVRYVKTEERERRKLVGLLLLL